MLSTQNQTFTLKSPASLFSAVALSVFISEALVMLLLHFLPPQSLLLEAAIDATLLVILISPTLYFFLFVPLVTHIQERQQAENILANNKEERLKSMIRASLDGFWITDVHGRFLEVNQSYCKMIGYDQEELLGMNVSDVEVITTHENMSAHLAQLLETGSCRYETRHRNKDGRILEIEVSANYSDLNEGQIYCFLRDITDQKLMADALLESEEKFRSMSNHTKDGLIMMDNMGNTSFWNTAAEKIFGYSAEEVVGKELHAFIAPANYYDAFKKVFKHFRETGEGPMVGKTRELTALRKGGAEFPVELAGHSIHISSSIGIAVYPEHGADEKSLTKNADVAMYHAKNSGRNKVKLFNPDMTAG